MSKKKHPLYTEAQETKAIIKEYRLLMKKAGILNKAVWLEVKDEKTGFIHKEYTNPYKKVLRYFMGLPTHMKIWELVAMSEALYGNQIPTDSDKTTENPEKKEDSSNGTDQA